MTRRFVPAMPLRVSAMRALGAYANAFPIENFMEELALGSDQDPVAFRLRHLDDPRAVGVIERARDGSVLAARPKAPGTGRGSAFARYKNLAARCALAVECEVDRGRGRVRLARAVAAVDGGQLVNPDGLRDRNEGATLRSMSWTLFEMVAFDASRIGSVAWTYPILRFDAVPGSVEVHPMDRPGQPFLGCGECGQGPTGAAIADAVEDATGVRLHDLPLTRDKVLAAIGA